MQPALVAQSFEFAVKLSYCASLAGLGMCEFLHPLFKPTFLIVNDRNETFSIQVEVGWRKHKTVNLNAVN